MARTETLRLNIETELAVGFLKAHNAIEIIPGRLLDIDFDLVGTQR